MRECSSGWRREVIPITLVLMGIVLCVSALNLLPRSKVLSQHTSPNGKWNVSEEFEGRSSCFCIILRDSAGKEIARDKSRFVSRYLIDLVSDHQSELEITDETAGEKGQPIWRLDAAHNKWHVIPP